MQAFQAAGLSTLMALTSATALSTASCAEIIGIEPWDVPETGGAGGGVSSASSVGTGGTGGGMPTVEGPSILRPSSGQTLAPRLAYLLWQNGSVPSGLTVTGYELCSTADPATDIDGDSQCPNKNAAFSMPHGFLALAPYSTYRIKLREVLQDGANQTLSSQWSAVQTFSTNNSLLGEWKMENDASDSSPSGINGTLQGGAGFASGIDGQALQCDGTDDFSDMGNSAVLNLPGPLTVSAWVKGNGIPTSADSGIVSLGDLNYGLTYHTNGDAYFYINNGGNSVHVPMSPDTWHRIAGVFDGTTAAGGMRLYLDDALAGTKASSFVNTGATGSLWIGRYNTSYFRGAIDEVAIYNVALSDADLLNEFCATQAQGGVEPMPAACEP